MFKRDYNTLLQVCHVSLLHHMKEIYRGIKTSVGGDPAVAREWQGEIFILLAARSRGPHFHRMPERTSSAQASVFTFIHIQPGCQPPCLCKSYKHASPINEMHGAPWLAGRRWQLISPVTASMAQGRVAAPPPRIAAVTHAHSQRLAIDKCTRVVRSIE